MPKVSTPCVNVCVLDPQSSLCIGCGRTGAEIGAWLTMSESERLALMGGLPERLAKARGGRVKARGGRVKARERLT